YIVQGARFRVIEGSGCQNAINVSGLELLLIGSWTITLPAISAFFYCPRIAYVFYRHRRELNGLFDGYKTTSRFSYLRILVVGCMDIIITLPFGIVTVILSTRVLLPGFTFDFYTGWTFTHTDWGPISVPYTTIAHAGGWQLFSYYFSLWSSVILSLIIFALFGLTAEARATYRRGISNIAGIVGWKSTHYARGSAVSQIVFSRPQFDSDVESQYAHLLY
ncbi:pheromone A receptor-domain-containing protein, partial [Vararia minispora EC-137]